MDFLKKLKYLYSITWIAGNQTRKAIIFTFGERKIKTQRLSVCNERCNGSFVWCQYWWFWAIICLVSIGKVALLMVYNRSLKRFQTPVPLFWENNRQQAGKGIKIVDIDLYGDADKKWAHRLNCPNEDEIGCALFRCKTFFLETGTWWVEDQFTATKRTNIQV